MDDENIMLKGVYEETLTDPNFQLVLVSQNHERKSGPKFNLHKFGFKFIVQIQLPLFS